MASAMSPSGSIWIRYCTESFLLEKTLTRTGFGHAL
ncbi:hypothetical protein SUDANB121_01038 [Nocardiopsis dassonvillei]